MVTDTAGLGQACFSTIRARARERRTWLCLGLDPDPAHLSEPSAIAAFCRQIIAATCDLVACFKLNFAFFERLGSEGWAALEEVRAAIPADVPVIADAKRGDVPHTAAAYASAIFDALHFDAVTVSPYLGWDSVDPFLRYVDKGVFVLCRTSNPGSGEVQELEVAGEPLYQKIARQALALNRPNLGLVVGATQPDALRAVRALCDDVLLLVPGVGAQGAAAEAVMPLAADTRGDNALINVSRAILYASPGADFAAAARLAAEAVARATWADNRGRG